MIKFTRNSTNSFQFFIICTASILSCVGLYIFNLKNITNSKDLPSNIYENKEIFNKILEIPIDDEYNKSIYNLIALESKLDLDLYNRKLNIETIKIFSKLSKFHKIKLETIKNINPKLFDFLYNELVNFQIAMYKNNQ